MDDLTPLNDTDETSKHPTPVVMFYGFSEREISHLVDAILFESNRKPAMAMVTEQVLDWTVQEYIETIQTEHRMYSENSQTKDIVSGEKND